MLEPKGRPAVESPRELAELAKETLWVELWMMMGSVPVTLAAGNREPLRALSIAMSVLL